MLSCCRSWSVKFQFPRTRYLSSPPLFSSLPFESSCLLPCILLLLLFHTASFSNFSSDHEVENTSGDPRLFPATFLPKCCHCYIVGGNHGVDVLVLRPMNGENCPPIVG